MNAFTPYFHRNSLLWSARVALTALLLSVVAATTGCVAIAAAGAAGAGVAWVRGTLETNVERDLDRVYRATQEAVQALDFAKISERKTGLDALLVSRTALDKKIEIVLKRVGANNTQIIIRVGVFGDETLSLAILDRIKREL